jgi:hypothetical protein
MSIFAGSYVYAGAKTSQAGKKLTKATDDPTVYVKGGGEKYHNRNCKIVPTGKKGIKLSEALAQGYEPCKICNPPTVDVYVNPKGKTYHKKSCKMVKKDAATMTIGEAKKNGLSACKICLPPKKVK